MQEPGLQPRFLHAEPRAYVEAPALTQKPGLQPVERIADDAGPGDPSRPGGAVPKEPARSDVGGWLLVGLAVLSLLAVVNPFVAAPLALVTLVAAATGMRGQSEPRRRRRAVAVLLSALVLAFNVVFFVFAAPVSTDSEMEPVQPAPLEPPEPRP